jgi:pyrroloquinoline quinone (PQQ) biosynthesis protein C
MMRGTSAAAALRPELRAIVDTRLDDMISRFYTEAPNAQSLVNDDGLNMGYYTRHTIETVLRIRRKRTVDAYALIHFTKHDPRRAKQWAAYTDEEMLHDELFVRDLEAVGVTRDEVYATEPFLATKALMGYLLYDVVYNDSPLALIASVYFIEYTTTRTQPAWIDKVERFLGKDAVKGARAHVSTDVDDNHADFVWGVLVSLLHDESAEAAVLDHLDNVYRLYVDYFTELNQYVAEHAPRTSAEPALV